MSELKSETIYFTHENGDAYAVDMYIKSEADKVIAELKKERDWLAKDRAQAYDDLEKRAQLNIKQEESIRHQKYKRCMAMAKYSYENHINIGDCYRCSTLTTHSFRMNFGVRWNCRWLELAEKFKPNH